MDSERKILGERLKSIRKTVGLSRNKIALDYGFSARSIELWERGQTGIDVLKLYEYLNIFKVGYGIEVSINSLVDFGNDLMISKKISVK